MHRVIMKQVCTVLFRDTCGCALYAAVKQQEIHWATFLCKHYLCEEGSFHQVKSTEDTLRHTQFISHYLTVYSLGWHHHSYWLLFQ